MKHNTAAEIHGHSPSNVRFAKEKDSCGLREKEIKIEVEK